MLRVVDEDPAHAQKVKPRTSTHGPTAGATTHGRSAGATSHGSGKTTHGGGSTTHGAGSTTHGPNKTGGPGTQSTTPGSGNGHGRGANSGTTDTQGTPGGVTLTHAQQLLTRNTSLREKLQSRLPEGTDVIAAAADFRNLGQFVAAVNVSNNLGLNFTDLKALMTGPDALSLGQAIQKAKTLDPTTANTIANTAMDDANRQINTTATTTASAKTKKTRH